MKICLCCGNTDPRKFVTMVNKSDETQICMANPACVENVKIEDIDEMLVDTIRVLNLNGYKTIHSCQGHHLGPGDGGTFYGPEGYISFEVDQENKEDFKKYKMLIESIPNKIDAFNMKYEIVKGPRSAEDRFTLSEKLVIRFEMDKAEILTQLDWLEQNISLHKKLFIRILDMLEDAEEEAIEEGKDEYNKSIKYRS